MKKIITYFTKVFLRKGWFDSKTLTHWILKKYPLKVTTRVDRYKTVYVKKGKIREWRTFDESGRRVDLLGLKEGDKIMYPDGSAK